jgi:hypothetical protein
MDSFASVLHIHAVQSLRDRVPPSEQDVGARVAVGVSHWGREMGLWCVVRGARGCGCGIRTIPILFRSIGATATALPVSALDASLVIV